MKNTWKKTLSLVLVLMVALIPCVCHADTFELPDVSIPGLEPYDETVTITVLQTDPTEYDRDSSIPGRTSLEDNAWIDAYLKYLNIKVERIIAEDATALNSLLNTMMASNELPDVFIASQEMYYTMLENEVLGDLTAGFDEAYENLPYFKQCIDTYSEEVYKHFTYEGEFKGIPLLTPSLGGENVLWIRQDWLDAVGKTAPTTIDELVDVAQAFKDAAFGGADTYGLGVWGNNVNEFINGYGVVCGTWAEMEDGSRVYADTQKELVSPALLKLQEMYKNGLLKADFAVSDTLDNDVANGLCGMVYGPTWYGATAVNANFGNDEKAVWIATFLPSESGEVLPCKTVENSYNNTIMVSAECEHPEAIFKMMNLELFVRNNDSEGLLKNSLYICDDGYDMWDLKVFRNIEWASVGLTQYEEARANLDKIRAGELKLEDIVFDNATVEMLTTAGAAALAGDRSQFGLMSVIEYGNLICNKLYYMGDKLVLPYYGPITENISLYKETINDELAAAMCDVVMGADISVYENAVDTWYANGGQAITDDVNAYYASAK